MTNNICIIVSGTLTNSISLYLTGIKKRAEALGYFCTVFSMLKFDRLDLGNQMKVYDQIDFSAYCGVIYLENSYAPHKSCGSQIEARIKEKCTVPVIVIGDSEYGYPSLNHSTEEAFRQLTDHMIEVHDCKVIYCLGGTKMRRTGRIEGFRQSLQDHNIPCPPEYIFYGGFWKECAEELARNIAHGNVEKPDAVVCLTDHIAYQLVKSLIEYGYKVPEDIRVAGFCGYECTFNRAMTLTSYQFDFEYIGSLSVTKLHEQLTGEIPPSVPKKQYHMVLGGTCGCNQISAREKRVLFEALDRDENCDMYFENAGIDCSFLECTTMEDVMGEVKRLNYLIPDKSLLAVDLYKGQDLSCYFISNLLEDTSPVRLKDGELLPGRINYMEECNNITIYPIPFKDEILGYILIGYKNPICPDRYVVKFTDYLIEGLKMVQATGGSRANLKSPEPVAAPDYIFVKNGDSLQKLPFEMVYYFETLSKHVYAVTKAGSYEVGKKLYELEEELDPEQFLRISKSTILNLSKVSSLHMQPNRTIEVFLLNKKLVHVSRTYTEEFERKVRL